MTHMFTKVKALYGIKISLREKRYDIFIPYNEDI